MNGAAGRNGGADAPKVPRAPGRGDTARPSLSVVVPCYDEAANIGELMASLAGQQWSEPWEVVVADNGSTDGSTDVVERFRDRLPGLRIVDASDRQGAPHARNVGARAARGEALAYIDADDVAAPGWVAALGGALSRHDFVASRYDNETLNDPWIVAARGRGFQAEGLSRTWYPPYLKICGGSGMGVRRDLLLRAGGFREEVLGAEDTDLSLRLQYEGTEPIFVPDAVVLMRFTTDAGGLFAQARWWGEWNVLLYKLHCPPGREIEDPWERVRRRYRWIGRNLVGTRLGNRVARYKLLWQLGWQLGLIMGSAKHRVSPPAWIPEDERPAEPEDPTTLASAFPERLAGGTVGVRDEARQGDDCESVEPTDVCHAGTHWRSG